MKKIFFASALSSLILSHTLFAVGEPTPEQTRFESLSKLTKVIGTVENITLMT